MRLPCSACMYVSRIISHLTYFHEEYYWHKYYDTGGNGNQCIMFWYTIYVEYKIKILQSCNIYINISIVVAIMKKLEKMHKKIWKEIDHLHISWVLFVSQLLQIWLRCETSKFFPTNITVTKSAFKIMYSLKMEIKHWWWW
jgi:hypothetical protein